jgi:hypothetical protein
MTNEMSRPRLRGLWRWPHSARRARAHAIVTAAVLWLGLIVAFVAGPGDRSIAGPIKGPDFLQFYTMGSLASQGRATDIYDFEAFHRAQVALVPESGPELYPPVYPPHAALVFAPFSTLPYRGALLVWTLITLVAYAAIIRSAWRPVAAFVPDKSLVVAAAAAFPPFWYCVLHGQATILVLAAFWSGWRALERGRRLLAGMAFGLLLLKPQFALPLAVVVLACRQWAMLAGAVASIAIQVGVVVLVLGWAAIEAYARFIPAMLANANLLEPKPFLSHSLRAVTRLAPDWLGMPLWLALSALVLVQVVGVWRSQAPLRVRVGTMMIASVLVSPHLIVYDATILALPLLWLAAYARERGSDADIATMSSTIYWLFVMLLVPTAAVIGVQLSVLLMMWVVVLTRRLTRLTMM